MSEIFDENRSKPHSGLFKHLYEVPPPRFPDRVITSSSQQELGIIQVPQSKHLYEVPPPRFPDRVITSSPQQELGIIQVPQSKHLYEVPPPRYPDRVITSSSQQELGIIQVPQSKRLYEVTSPTSLNVDLIRVQSVQESKLLYEVQPPKQIKRKVTPELVKIETIKLKSKLLYQVLPPIKILPPPDITTVNKMVHVKAIKHQNLVQNSSESLILTDESISNWSRYEYENRI
jgi:hypothetical protein